MERKANLPPPSAPNIPFLRPAAAAGDAKNHNATTSSSSSSSPRSPPDFLRHMNAAFKRHRPLGTLQSNASRASRFLVSQPESSKITGPSSALTRNNIGKRPSPAGASVGVARMPSVRLNPEDTSLTPPSITGTMSPSRTHNDDAAVVAGKDKLLVRDAPNLAFQSLDARTATDTRMDAISSRFPSLALTEGEGHVGSAAGRDDNSLNQGHLQSMEMPDAGGKFGDGARFLDRRDEPQQDQHFGSMYATTMSVNSGPSVQCTRAPSGQTGFVTQMSSSAAEPSIRVHDLGFSQGRGAAPKEDEELQCQPSGLTGFVTQMPSSAAEPAIRVHDLGFSQGRGAAPKEDEGLQCQQQAPRLDEDINQKGVSDNASCFQAQVPSAENIAANSEHTQSSKVEKSSRKKKYDPDVFFKVSGKLYQKLGKIGSGGSSEVHKVISSDCKIYALKKIKLKGRDYATAYGFCQEVEYLNRLKGKNNIIQLIDYEVTDKALLQGVVDGTMSLKDGKIRDDQYIYMVLEYGEIDLAHMLSHKWKELDGSIWKIDENWLRFYWQQMLESVNTIHEDRIVHSDLKPANFLLVRGSLKLIDFGIAKAIMSDTTNIQRDAQVGTLNYMSPEAFMWNEQDTTGNTIKCGRPSDIWSLGCILYQMVYGKTPFAEYKTFWAKFKVITDKHHKISYEPVSNPWLIDLMQRCLAWDRNERWRIPQLLQHPFLVPPMPKELPLPQHHPYTVVMEKVGVYWDDPEVSRLCSELHRVIADIEKRRHYPTIA